MALRGISRAFAERYFMSRIGLIRGFAEDKAPDSGNGDTENSESPQIKEMEARMKALQSEALQYKDLYIRAVAEQENIRKKMMKDIESEREYTISRFAKEILEVSDKLNKTIDSVSDEKVKENPQMALKELMKGVVGTKDVLKTAFGKFSILEYCPNGEKFDPNVHEALFAYEDPSKEAGTIGQICVNGFKIKDRVLRSAKVGIIKK